MEVDHFDPRKKSNLHQKYDNLFLSTRHCNKSKRDAWPTTSQRKRGLRLLNPCEETDYGVHIFENIATGELFSPTPEGRFHLRVMDLNAPHFVNERKLRTELWKLLHQEPRPAAISSIRETQELVSVVRRTASRMIREWPAFTDELAANAQ